LLRRSLPPATILSTEFPVPPYTAFSVKLQLNQALGLGQDRIQRLERKRLEMRGAKTDRPHLESHFEPGNDKVLRK